tara:strand:- start:374 stop:685 length:312 start_codon:yes stop_codon:yes gene_type:complete
MYTFDQVFTSQTANGSTSSLNWDGGKGQVMASGTWDSATLQLESSPDGGTTWISCGDECKLSDSGMFNFDLNPCNVRLTVASAGGSTSLNVWITSEEYGSSKI